MKNYKQMEWKQQILRSLYQNGYIPYFYTINA